MIHIREDSENPWAEVADELTGGLRRGVGRAKQYAAQLGIEREKNLRNKKIEDTLLKERGREAIDRMRDIIGRGKTGWNLLNYLTPEGRADRAALDSAALNLERLAVEMQGKGVLSKPRFEYMTKRLPSSTKTDAENEAILKEWEEILSSAEQMNEEDLSKKKRKKESFNPSNKEHQAKARQLHKKLKDKEKVREALRREFEGL